MDDRLAAKLLSGATLVMIGDLMRQSVDLFLTLPLCDGASERDRPANDGLRAEVGAVVRERAAAHWDMC
jgi:hypothetical protein